MEGVTELQVGPYRVIKSSIWVEKGINHGFIGTTGNFSDSNLDTELPKFLSSFEIKKLFLPRQVHGNHLISIEEDSIRESEGDGLIVSNRGGGIAYGIRTADCLPIMIRSSTKCALVHAGWRGLASGIVEASVERFQERAQDLEVFIGPSAGKDRYEVGFEVIRSIGEDKAVSKQSGGVIYLDLQGTASAILTAKGVPLTSILCVSRCTISQRDLHSFRRDRDKRGSNLLFFIPSQ